MLRHRVVNSRNLRRRPRTVTTTEIHMADSTTTTVQQFKTPVLLKVDGSNYVNWESNMEALLRAAGDSYWLMASAGGVPAKDPEKAMTYVLNLLFNSIDPIITQRIYSGKTNEEKTALTKPKELWAALKNYCTSATGASEISAFSKFTTFKFDNSLPAEENLTKFENILYTIQISGTSIPDKLIQAQLIQSLHGEEWTGFKNSISGNPPSTFSALKTRIVTAVIQQSIDKPDVSEVTALMANANIRGRGKRRPNYRQNFRGRGRGRGGPRRYQQREVRTSIKEERYCFNCGKKGHISTDCYSRRNYQRREINAIEGPEVNMTQRGELCDVFDSAEFVVDSGATNHCEHSIKYLNNYQPFSKRVEVKFGDSHSTLAFGQGSIDINFYYRGSRKVCRLLNVLFVPGLRRNLFSISKAAEAGWSFEGNKDCFQLKVKDIVINTTKKGSLYFLKIQGMKGDPTAMATPKKDKVYLNVTEIGSLQKMHEALGHINKVKVK